MNTLSIADIKEIRANINRLAEVLKTHPAHVAGDIETAAGAKLAELTKNREQTTDLNYLTGLSVYGTGLMVDSMLSELRERVFELEEQFLLTLQHNVIQHEIIEHNLDIDKIECPKKFSEQATFYLKRKGAAQ